MSTSNGPGRGNGGSDRNHRDYDPLLALSLLAVAAMCVVAETVLACIGVPPQPWVGTLAGAVTGAVLLWMHPPRRD